MGFVRVVPYFFYLKVQHSPIKPLASDFSLSFCYSMIP